MADRTFCTAPKATRTGRAALNGGAPGLRVESSSRTIPAEIFLGTDHLAPGARQTLQARFEQGCTFLRAPGSSWATAAGADVTQASGIAPGAQWTKHACLQSCSTNLATPGTFWAVLTSRSCLRTSLVTPGSCSAFYAASITAPGALGTRQAGCPWRRPPLPSITRACGQCCCVVLQQAKPNFLDRLKVQGVFPTRIGSAESKEKKPKIPHVELF